MLYLKYNNDLLLEDKMNYITLIKKDDSITNSKEIKKYELTECDYSNLDLVDLKSRESTNELYGIKKIKRAKKTY